MINGKKVIVVMPAYRAEKTVKQTIADVPAGVVDEFLLVDDASPDETVKVAQSLGITVIRHEKNLGYGGNQKTCYRNSLRAFWAGGHCKAECRCTNMFQTASSLLPRIYCWVSS